MPLAAKPNVTNLDPLFAGGWLVQAEKNEVILSKNDTDPPIYQIEDGFVKVYSISPRGEEYVHLVYKTGEVFSLTWLLKGKMQDVFYEALTDVRLRCVAKEDLLKLIQTDAQAAYTLLEQLAEQFRVHINRLDNLQFRHAHERVAYRLQSLAERFGVARGQKVTINAPFTHQLIADSINLTRESVSREIEKLEASGIVNYSEHKIVINSIKRLILEFDNEG
jgi:CRP/FNR family transcriptional regulator, cyclic AMP receptor protein